MSEEVLYSLNGKKLDEFNLKVYDVVEGRSKNEVNFKIDLLNGDGVRSRSSCVKGKFFSGRGENYKPWMDIYFRNLLEFDSHEVDIKNEIDIKLFKVLSDYLPPGSKMMIAYSNHNETYKGLNRDFPPPLTYVGFLLWESGFKWFKDWYFAEGFREGHIKLQGNKPINMENRIKNLLKQQDKINNFLKEGKRKDKIYYDSKKRANILLEEISSELSKMK